MMLFTEAANEIHLANRKAVSVVSSFPLPFPLPLGTGDAGIRRRIDPQPLIVTWLNRWGSWSCRFTLLVKKLPYTLGVLGSKLRF